MTHELTFEQIQKSKKLFDLECVAEKEIDGNIKDFKMPVSRLAVNLANLGFPVSEEDLEEMKKSMNIEDSIDFPTFLRIAAIKFKQIELEKELEGAFKAFDKSNKGVLNYDELRSIITEHGPKLALDEADSILTQLGIGKDNEGFDYKIFVSDTLT